MKKKYPAGLALAACVALFAPLPSGAREYTLSGGVGLYQNYDSNVFREKNHPVSQWRSTIAPSLTVRSESQYDQVVLNYAPGYTYNDRTDEGNVDHQFSLLANCAFAKNFKGKLSNNFSQGEDTAADRTGTLSVAAPPSSSTFRPTATAEGETGTAVPPAESVFLSPDRAARRHSTNRFLVGTSYEYGKESFLDLSYANEKLNNDDPAVRDYVRHRPGAMLRHRFSPEWGTDLSLDYSKGDFNRGEDLTTTSPGIRINHNYSPHTTFFGDYQYSKTDYSGTSPGYETHTPALGYSGSLDQFTSLTAQLGVALTKRDNGDSTNGLSYSLALARRLEHGRFSINGAGGQEARNFYGTTTTTGATEGLSQYWLLAGNLTHQLWKDISVGFDAGVRSDDLIEQTTDSKKTSYDAGASLSYAFLRYYALSLRYNFRQVNADRDTDEYETHQVYLALSAAKDMLKW